MNYILQEDTICALATGGNMSAIAVIRISGKDAIDITNMIFSKDLSLKASHTIHHGVITDNDRLIDEVLISIFRETHMDECFDIVDLGRWDFNVDITTVVLITGPGFKSSTHLHVPAISVPLIAGPCVLLLVDLAAALHLVVIATSFKFHHARLLPVVETSAAACFLIVLSGLFVPSLIDHAIVIHLLITKIIEFSKKLLTMPLFALTAS